jgi:hypothetical protein
VPLTEELKAPLRVPLVAVSLRLAPEEPEAGPWRAQPLTVVADTVLRHHGYRTAGHRRPVVLAVDGRSSSGKTTLAARLHAVVPESAVVHTDDIAWWHSRFGWVDLLIGGILAPVRAGRSVSYRPPQWDERGRPGAIEVPLACSLLIIEGVGAARRESADLTDAAIWVQADVQVTEQRNLARVGQPGGPATAEHLRDWMAEEIPFLAGERPWEHADLIACGTPRIAFDAGTDLVVAPPLACSPNPARSA